MRLCYSSLIGGRTRERGYARDACMTHDQMHLQTTCRRLAVGAHVARVMHTLLQIVIVRNNLAVDHHMRINVKTSRRTQAGLASSRVVGMERNV
jgi:hypothetical protein